MSKSESCENDQQSPPLEKKRSLNFLPILAYFNLVTMILIVTAYMITPEESYHHPVYDPDMHKNCETSCALRQIGDAMQVLVSVCLAYLAFAILVCIAIMCHLALLIMICTFLTVCHISLPLFLLVQSFRVYDEDSVYLALFSMVVIDCHLIILYLLGLYQTCIINKNKSN